MGDGADVRLEHERDELTEVLPGYEIGEVLGRGAFAAVYAARQVGLERDVAIKRLSPELLRDDDARQRFAAEARLLGSLDHPHVVRVHDYVERDGVGALVMERLHGGTLADRMAVGPIPPARACAIALATLHGLEHAHQRGVLHRDVKPANLLFGEGDLLKVADFGIAKVVGARGARLTATAGTLGTPAFMAPEQVRRSAGPLSSATDVWAVGAVLYELLAGQPPFTGDEELAEVLLRRVEQDAAPLPGDVPAVVAGVVMRALEREPERRFATAGAFAVALEQAAQRAYGPESLEATGIPVHRTSARASSQPTLLEPGPDLDLARPARPRRRRLVAGALAALALAGGGTVVALSGDDEAPTAEQAALAALPPTPPGWPSGFALGTADFVGGPAAATRRWGRGGLYPAIFDGDAAARKDWSRTGPDPEGFAREAQAAGQMPFLIFYGLRSLGQDGKDDHQAPGIRRTLVDEDLMRTYWGNVREFLRRVGRTRRPAAIAIEPGMWALVQQALDFSGDTAGSVPASVASSGLPELRDLQNTFRGYSSAWIRLRNRYAPRVLLGPGLDDYGTNVDFSRAAPDVASAVGHGRRAAAYTIEGGNPMDFVAFETAFSEQGADPNRENVYSDRERRVFAAYLKEFVRVSKLPVTLLGVPQGNTVMKTIDDKPFHYRDTWVQWLVGDARFSGLRLLRDAGVIGIAMGVPYGGKEYAEFGTCPCDAAEDGVTNGGERGRASRSADDDGGFWTERMAALRRAGGLEIAPQEPGSS